MDIANNPTYASYVPLSSCLDAANTVNFGDKTTDQLKVHYNYLRNETRRRTDVPGLAFFDVDPASGRFEFSFDEDSSIMDITNNPAYASCVPLSV